MAIAAIHHWLSVNGAFEAGVELLKLHGKPSSAELFLFGLGDSPAARFKLTQALRKLNDGAVEAVLAHHATAQPTEQPSPSEERLLQLSAGRDVPSDLPEDVLPVSLRPLRRELKELHQEMTMKRGIMVKTPDGHELRDIASEVVSLQRRIKHGWHIIQFWRDTRKVLKRDEPSFDLGQMLTERQRLRVWLSQRRSGARKSPAETIRLKEEQLVALEKRIADAAGS